MVIAIGVERSAKCQFSPENSREQLTGVIFDYHRQNGLQATLQDISGGLCTVNGVIRPDDQVLVPQATEKRQVNKRWPIHTHMINAHSSRATSRLLRCRAACKAAW